MILVARGQDAKVEHDITSNYPKLELARLPRPRVRVDLIGVLEIFLARMITPMPTRRAKGAGFSYNLFPVDQPRKAPRCRRLLGLRGASIALTPDLSLFGYAS